MEANNGSGNNESRDSWETPKELWNKLDNQYCFAFDCCANNHNSKCPTFSDNFEQETYISLSNFNCWMNPPFSKAYEMFEHFFKVVSRGIAIYRCDNMETKIWQNVIIPHCDWIFIPKGRVCYEGMEGKGSRFPSALIGIGVEPPKALEGCTLMRGKNDSL